MRYGIEQYDQHGLLKTPVLLWVGGRSDPCLGGVCRRRSEPPRGKYDITVCLPKPYYAVSRTRDGLAYCCGNVAGWTKKKRLNQNQLHC